MGNKMASNGNLLGILIQNGQIRLTKWKKCAKMACEWLSKAKIQLINWNFDTNALQFHLTLLGCSLFNIIKGKHTF